MTEVLKGHIRDHLGRDDATAGERAEDVETVARILRSYLK